MSMLGSKDIPQSTYEYLTKHKILHQIASTKQAFIDKEKRSHPMETMCVREFA